MSDLNMPGDDGGILGEAGSDESEPAQEQRGDEAGVTDDGGGDGDLGLGAALAAPD